MRPARGVAAWLRGKWQASPAFFLTGVAVWLVALSWMRPLTLPDEGRYAGVAWEMLRSGRLSVPLLDGMPYFHKPPLYYWLAAGAMHLFGLQEWAARAPSLLAAWAAAAGLYAFVRRHREAEAARMAVLVLISMPLFFGGAQFANLDMLVASLIALCVLAAADTVLRRAHGRPWRAMALAAATLAALAVLAKGLIGLVLPGAALAVWLAWRRDGRGMLALLWPPALALFAAISVPWFWLMQARYPGFFQYFFVYQHFERYAETGFNNAQPFWFYLPVLAGLTLPWSLWGGGLLRGRFWRAADDPDGLRRLMAAWLVVVVLFFSLPASKLVGYVLPALPPLAFLLAEVVQQARAREPAARHLHGRLAGAGLLAAAAICVVAVNVAAMRPRGSVRDLAARVVPELAPGDVTVALHAYPFDLGFYTGLRQPVWVVDDWEPSRVAHRDNWRKELYDAGRFAPAMGREVLVSPQEWLRRMCEAPDGSRYWIWGEGDDGGWYRPLAGMAAHVADARRRVWLLRVDEAFRRRACAGMPTAGSPGR